MDQNGQTGLQSVEMIIYSGHPEEDAIHTEGVAFMMDKKAQRALISWEPVSSRIITARFNTRLKKKSMYVILCYAPTNEAEEEKKTDFYDLLQATIDKAKANDLVLVMGDMNAKVGSRNDNYKPIMGTQGLGDMNDNGQLFADFCLENDLVIGGSLFPHKTKHKATWVSPDHITENQIDHIAVSRRHRRSLLDVRVKRGADVASDHHVLSVKMQLKLRNYPTTTMGRQKLAIELLKDENKKEQFEVEVNNRYEVLRHLMQQETDTGLTLEDLWDNMKKVWKEPAESILGKKQRSNKPWISQKTLEKLEERRRAKARINQAQTRQQKKTS